MSSTCLLDAVAEAEPIRDKWVFVTGRRTSGPATAVRRLRLRARTSRPVLRLADVPEFGSGDVELASDLEQAADAAWR